MSERKVDMVRLERPEEVYDVEEVLGRDTRSVFPTKAKAELDNAAKLSTEAIQEMLGAKRFVTEKELESIKASKGLGNDDGSNVPLKPLVEVLREAKERKEQDFADKWKMMKTGKNRPLEDDELEFLDSIAEQEAARRREQLQHEQAELEAFRKATAAVQGEGALTSGLSQDTTVKPTLRPPQAMGVKKGSTDKLVVRAVIKPKAKQTEMPVKQQAGVNGSESHEPQLKRAKTDSDDTREQPQTEQKDAQEGLGGLLGDYGSDSDVD